MKRGERKLFSQLDHERYEKDLRAIERQDRKDARRLLSEPDPDPEPPLSPEGLEGLSPEERRLVEEATGFDEKG